MNTKISRSPVRTPLLPLALMASVGADGGGGGPAPKGRIAPPPGQPLPPQLSAGVGWENHPNAARMRQMSAAVGASCGPVSNQPNCIPGYSKELTDSMGNMLCDMPTNLPPNVDRATLQYIMNQIALSRYATVPSRLGWLCDSISYTSPAPGVVPDVVANAVVGTLALPPTRSFNMDALVMAAGNEDDPLYFVTAFEYDGIDYVGTGPWISVLYTPESACCLCVRVVPIIEKNTTLSISITNGPVANVFIFGTLFGSTLFSGAP